MGPVLLPIAIVGSLALGVASFQQQKKAAKAQERAMKEQQKMQELADARARRQLLRQTAMQRGETVNLASAYGAMGGSGIQGGLSGLNNQVASQLGFQQTGVAASQYITNQNIAASRYMTMAGQYDLFGQFFKSLPGMIPGGSFGGGTPSSTYNPLT